MTDDLSDDIKSAIVSSTQMELDRAMAPYDVWGTRAHVLMLARTDIIDEETCRNIQRALDRIENEMEEGTYDIDPEQGAHLSLEKKIIDYAGEEAGLSTHTARSRNDQVMVTELLYLREQVLDLFDLFCAVLRAFGTRAENHVSTPMPGYTHMQPAKPTSFASWCMGHASALLRSAEQLQFQYDRFDRCPLGAVESYGTSWPIDREYTAELLGFDGVWPITQDAISSRGTYQLALLSGMNETLLAAGRAASDLLLFSTHESDYVDFGENVAQRLHPVTGSSVMAQKKNPDALELVRGSAPQLAGMVQIVSGLLQDLPTGYNRDSREVKRYISDGLNITSTALTSLEEAVSTLVVHEERMEKAVRENYSLTTDLADGLARETNTPYRKMYDVVGQAVNALIQNEKTLADLTTSDLQRQAEQAGLDLDLSEISLDTYLDPTSALARRSHTGGPAPEEMSRQIERVNDQRTSLETWINERRDRIRRARRKTDEARSKTNGADNHV